jgi:hypothetical protein
MIFDPNEASATIVHTSEGQAPCRTDYTSELEAYLRDKEINAIMRQRTSVCG